MGSLVKLYMRQRCHLCEDAKALLEELQRNWQIEIVEVDIDENDELTERYGITIPVIELNGEEIQAGIINKNFIVEAFSEKNVKYIG
ncbi:glutaredoxin family protein [Bacillus sp. FJAT-27251]|uniref:glutaredoxin family protein n=1 Tax=Bacillus sp. FJAT-27251 TaxID=1684142 RepID=UPI0006A79ACD|nr:glutaredoxin family protein [Bacillus sp. FJAT-27251]